MQAVPAGPGILGIAPFVEGTATTLLRVYNPVRRPHLYTTDGNEYQVLGANGWSQDGGVGKLLGVGGKVLGRPTIALYRLHSPVLGKHLFTTDANEYAVLATFGWVQDGVVGYMSERANTDPNVVTKAFMRLYQPALRQHLYTTDANEVNVLTTQAGWTNEEAVGYWLE